MVELMRDDDAALYTDFDNRNRGKDRASLVKLPTIDLSPFTGNGNTEARASVAREIRQACTDLKNLYLVGHGLAPSDLDAILDHGRRFFALPLEEKRRVPFSPGGATSPNSTSGYLSGAAVSDDRTVDIKDIKERLIFKAERATSKDERAVFPPAKQNWPDPRALPGFQAFLRASYKAVTLHRQLSQALARGVSISRSRISRRRTGD